MVRSGENVIAERSNTFGGENLRAATQPLSNREVGFRSA